MQLQQIRPQGLDNSAQRRVVGVDGQGDLARPASHLRAEFSRARKLKMPRRRWKEYEAHHIGAGLQSSVKRLNGGQAAYLDDQGHGLE
jgi:hypothetical protein